MPTCISMFPVATYPVLKELATGDLNSTMDDIPSPEKFGCSIPGGAKGPWIGLGQPELVGLPSHQ